MTQYEIGPYPTLVYILSSFIANVGVSITGFGMALIFVFVYTIFDMFGNMKTSCTPLELCDMKYAVFVQSLSLVGSVPYLMYKAKIPTHANKSLLSTLMPVTLLSTPAGQLLQDTLPSSWLCIVFGTVVSVVVGWKILEELYCKKEQESEDDDTKPITTPNSEQEALLMESSRREGKEQTYSSTTDGGKEKSTLLPIKCKEINDFSDNGESQEEGGSLQEFSSTSIFIWGAILGFLSGFLGGLIGMRGPPLMVFFLYFPFPKMEVRAVGAVMLFFNMVLRILFYILDDLLRHSTTSDNDDGTPPWFLSWSSSWQLYVGVVVAGILGVPIGDWIHHHYIDQNKFRIALAFLLTASGVVNIAKGLSEI